MTPSTPYRADARPDAAEPGDAQLATPPGPIASLWRLRTYVRPYRLQMALMLAAAILGVGASLVVPLVIRHVVDGAIAHGQRSLLLPLSGLALALGVTEAGLAFTRRWIQSTSTLGIEQAVRDDVYRHLQQMPPSFHDGWQTGQLLSRAFSDLGAIRRFFGFGLVFLITNILTFAAILVLLVRLDPLLGVLVAVCLVPVAFLCGRFQRSFSRVSRRAQDQTGDLTTLAEEAATGIRVVKAFGRHELVEAQYLEASRQVQETQLEKVRLRARFAALLDLAPNATLVLVLLLGALAVGSGRLTLGGLVAFITLVLQLVWPVASLGFIIASGQEAGTAAQRVYEVLDAVPDVADTPHARHLPPVRGHVRFEGVSFAHPAPPGAAPRPPVLRGVDLEIRPGETLALVGASGSGKTTLAMLLPRLADPTAGRITLDGHDLREVTLQSLRLAVATAFEDPVLFSASVRDNVTLGHPHATDEEVEQALDLAQARFVHDLPEGLSTKVGEQGLSLSGGQRQRLALARAVIGKPAVLVLDDPLSALDVETEHLVEQALARVLATTTSLVVVHRPSTVALADRVALLVDGRVAAVGTHSELMATVPEYAAMLGSQAADASEAVAR
ncbi:MAG TPA: ABC transporter ATP-binding protein [Motilibacteraceae bacterium]|nr:ABC transporter ATP-binding protein [Motilibacteraceae bacterium]